MFKLAVAHLATAARNVGRVGIEISNHIGNTPRITYHTQSRIVPSLFHSTHPPSLTPSRDNVLTRHAEKDLDISFSQPKCNEGFINNLFIWTILFAHLWKTQSSEHFHFFMLGRHGEARIFKRTLKTFIQVLITLFSFTIGLSSWLMKVWRRYRWFVIDFFSLNSLVFFIYIIYCIYILRYNIIDDIYPNFLSILAW